MTGRSGRPTLVGLSLTLALALTLTLALASCASTDAVSTPGRPDATIVSPSPSVLVPAPDLTVAVDVTVAPDESRVLLIGDSTLLAVRRYNAFDALRGFEYVFDAESCRTLGIPSCGEEPKPPNSVEAIGAADGNFDMVVIMAGYDEWWTSFPSSFDEVVEASRAKGASHIIWLTFREGVGYTAPDGATANEAFVKNNVTLRENVASGQYPDVVIADWFEYTKSPDVESEWLSKDGIHLTQNGSFAVADYISRTIAHVEGRPCPMPWSTENRTTDLSSDDDIDVPCPAPDQHSPVADIRSLYP